MKAVFCVMFAGAVVSSVIGGCASGGSGSPRVVTLASESQTASLLNRMKSLEGEWTSADPESGEVVTAAVFRTTSAGSAVREVMFPGTAHEMTNMYHMDGSSLVMTHYCAGGNQPRMRAARAEGNTIPFQYESVMNMTSADEAYMGELTIEFKDADHIVQHWRTFKNGVVLTGESPSFELTRKR